jgi:hypothetical protein
MSGFIDNKKIEKIVYILFTKKDMLLRSGTVYEQSFKEELTERIKRIKKCKVKRNYIHGIIHTLTFLEENIPRLLESKTDTKKIVEWLNRLEKQSYHSKSIQRFDIRSILLLRKKTSEIKKEILSLSDF